MPIRRAEGRITRWFGTWTDIDDLKRMKQGKGLLSQDLSHRIKIIFAVVSALVGLSAREHPKASIFVSAVRDRIAAPALARPSAAGTSTVRLTCRGALALPYQAPIFSASWWLIG